MTPEELKREEASSAAFVASARPLVEKMARELGLEAKILADSHISHHVQTETVTVHGVKVDVKLLEYGTMSGKPKADPTIEAEVEFCLPETAVLANTYMDHVAAAEGLKKNAYYKYFAGPAYKSQESLRNYKNTDVCSPWNNNYFSIRTHNYRRSEIEEAVEHAILLAKPFVAHLSDLAGMRRWETTDEEVIAKAKEIIANADFVETDVDAEYKAHWLRDRNSFFKGWFFPLNDRERGTFDTLWPSSVERAAIGIEGTFEFAVSSLLLVDPRYIKKAREACRIRKEKIKIRY